MPPSSIPLAERLRPKDFGSFVGQKHLLFPGHPLRRAIEDKRPFSMLLLGPPGSGKTTLFSIMAERFLGAIQLKGQDLTAKRLKDLMDKGKNLTLLVDEAHRISRIEQDRLLPALEEGRVILIGATTENPTFYLTRPLLSRLSLFRLKALDYEDILTILKRGIQTLQNETNGQAIPFPEDWLQQIARLSEGDARLALGMLERAHDHLLSLGHPPDPSLKAIADVLGQAPLPYDRAKDEHYDTISAFIKSVRGSDPDGAVFWLVRMIEGGEDPLFLVRRMMILAAEDIGNADPWALILTAALKQTIELIGLPEGLIPMAQVTLYLSLAPKSNASYTALKKAKLALKTFGAKPVPDFLKNPISTLDKHTGKGKGYIYPHDNPEGIGNLSFLPQGLENLTLYEPKEVGFEKVLRERLQSIKSKKRQK